MTDLRPLFSLTVGEFKELFDSLAKGNISEFVSGLAEKGKNTEENLTVKQLSIILNCSTMSIHNYIKGGLPHYRVGRKILFNKSDVFEYMKFSLKGKRRAQI